MLLTPLEPHFAAALRDVNASNAAFRAAAAARLGRPNAEQVPEAMAALGSLLHDDFASVRDEAFQSITAVLSAFPEQQGESPLAIRCREAAFHDGHQRVRSAALRAALAALPDDVDWALDLSSDEDPDIRAQVVMEVTSRNTESASLPTLRRAVRDPVALVAAAACDRFQHAKDLATEDVLLLKGALSGNASFSAALALAVHGDSEGEGELVLGLRRRDDQHAALLGLAHLQTGSSLAVLQRFARKLWVSASAKHTAIVALAFRKDPSALAKLETILTTRRDAVFLVVLDAIRSLSFTEMHPRLLELMNERPVDRDVIAAVVVR